MAASVTYLTPPRLSSLPAEVGQLEYSSRSMVFPRDGAGLLRVWGDLDAPCVLRVEEAGARWRITAWDVDPPGARRAVRDLFSLEHPLERFYRATRGEPVLRESSRRFAGLRLPRDGSLYESLVHAVIGQQLSVAVAVTLQRRLVALAGSVRTVDGLEVPHLPGPKALLGLEPGALARVGLSRAKQAALLGIARATLEGAFEPLAGFRNATAEVAVARLDALPGVGRWTAENALLRAVGRTDLFLAGDLGVRHALASYGAVTFPSPEASARAWADRWYPGWGSYATLYLWRKWVADGTPKVTAARKVDERRAAGGPRRAR
jgi:DNA-3-methyladenine glycosylase II